MPNYFLFLALTLCIITFVYGFSGKEKKTRKKSNFDWPGWRGNLFTTDNFIFEKPPHIFGSAKLLGLLKEFTINVQASLFSRNAQAVAPREDPGAGLIRRVARP